MQSCSWAQSFLTKVREQQEETAGASLPSQPCCELRRSKHKLKLKVTHACRQSSGSGKNQADLSLLWTHAAAAFYPGAPNQAELPDWCARKQFTTLQQAVRAPQEPGRELPAGGAWQLMQH